MLRSKNSLRKTLASVLAIVFLISLLPATVFADEPDQDGDITGIFTLNNVPDVTDFTIKTVDNYESDNPGEGSVVSEGSALTPNTWYDFVVSVEDADNISDITEIAVRGRHFASAGSGHFDYFTGDAQTTPPTGKELFFTWTTEDGFEFAGNDPEHWEYHADKSSLPIGAGLEGTTFDFVFRIKISKVAEETSASNVWWFGIGAADEGTSENWKTNASALENEAGFLHTNTHYQMNFYGEIEVPGEDPQVVWNGLVAGGNYADDNAKAGLDFTITYIANGHYAQQIKTDETWERDGEGDSATLITDGVYNGSQKFGLKAYYEDNEGEAVQVKTDWEDIEGGISSTMASGTDVDTHHLYIRLSESFDFDTYRGTITYGITNDEVAQ
jgi:hypothetical protein